MKNYPVCMGCMLQPGFTMPPPSAFPAPKFTAAEGLTEGEREVLHFLKSAWDRFVSLGNHVEYDITEFNYAIHLLQQKMAVRVARRIDTDVWRQPD